MPHIIQIMPVPENDPYIMYGLDDGGDIWVLYFSSNGYTWERLNIKNVKD